MTGEFLFSTHEPIIDKDAFEADQRIRNSRRR